MTGWKRSSKTLTEGIRSMAKILREISEESEAMEKEIATALSKSMNIPESSVSGKMVVNMAIKELHKKIVKNA